MGSSPIASTGKKPEILVDRGFSGFFCVDRFPTCLYQKLNIKEKTLKTLEPKNTSKEGPHFLTKNVTVTRPDGRAVTLVYNDGT